MNYDDMLRYIIILTGCIILGISVFVCVLYAKRAVSSRSIMPRYVTLISLSYMIYITAAMYNAAYGIVRDRPVIWTSYWIILGSLIGMFGLTTILGLVQKRVAYSTGSVPGRRDTDV